MEEATKEYIENLEEENIKLVVKLELLKELKEDSVAYKIKDYFTPGTITIDMLFKFDKGKNKLMVSQKVLKYLLSLCNDTELLNNYDMEISKE